jgi:hypothetical protein
MAARAAGTAPRVSPPGAAAQLVLRLPVVVVVTLSENEQSVIAPMSMYWPSQKSPPWGLPHLVVHPPVSMLTHDSSHEMFAWTVHDPLQQSWHSVVQSVEPGCSWHFCVHWESQLAEHSASQSLPLHPAVHPALQSVEHWSLHVKVAGVVVQAVLHLVSQVSVQVVDADSVHIAEHVVV